MKAELKFIYKFKWIIIPYSIWPILFMHLMVLPYNKTILFLIIFIYATVMYIRAAIFCKKQQYDFKIVEKILVFYPGILTTIYIIFLFSLCGITGINSMKQLF